MGKNIWPEIPPEYIEKGYWKKNACGQYFLTMSYWPADISGSLLDLTVAQALRNAAAEAPDQIVLVEGIVDKTKRRRWTYSQLLADAERIASALLSRFTPGERIAIWAPNVPEWVLIEFGCALAGMTVVTVNPANQARELLHIVEQAAAAGLFVMEEYRNRSLIDIAGKVQKKHPSLREVIGFSQLNDFIDSAPTKQELPEIKPTDPIIIMFTSGTTGPPKGAVLHNMGVINACAFSLERAGFEEGGVYINASPMCHIGGCGIATLGILMKHGTQVLLNDFDSELMLKLIESEKGTFTSIVPTVIEALLANPNRKQYDVSTLKSLITGGAGVKASLVRRVESELGARVVISFGQTEMHGIISGTHKEDSPEDQAGTAGQPMPYCEVKIADPDTEEILPIGAEGEICCRGFNTMLRYENMPEATAKVLKKGWLHSGDLGSMDERGFLKITGRLKDKIIRGGENIHPTEIEFILREHPQVGQAVVFGVQDDYWGEEVHAVIVPKSGEGLPGPLELYEFCDANMAHFKVPRYWYFTDKLPMTPTGKIQRFILKQLVEKEELKPAAIIRQGKIKSVRQKT